MTLLLSLKQHHSHFLLYFLHTHLLDRPAQLLGRLAGTSNYDGHSFLLNL